MSATMVKRQGLGYETNPNKHNPVASLSTFGSRPSSSSTAVNTAGCIGTPWTQNIWGSGGLSGTFDTKSRSDGHILSTKTGSGLLAESSIPDPFDHTVSQGRQSVSKLSPQNAFGSAQPQANVQNSTSSSYASAGGFNRDTSTFTSKAPINLNLTSRSGFDNVAASSAFYGAEQPPTVYTKFDRPTISQSSRPAGSDQSAWADQLTSFSFAGTSQSALPLSRNNSLSNSRHSTVSPAFPTFDHAQANHQGFAPANSSRHGSLVKNQYSSEADTFIPQFGQLTLDNDRRGASGRRIGSNADAGFIPATQYSSYSNGHSNTTNGDMSAYFQPNPLKASRHASQYSFHDANYPYDSASQYFESQYDPRFGQQQYYQMDGRRDSVHGRDLQLYSCVAAAFQGVNGRAMNQNELMHAMRRDPQVMQMVLSLANQYNGFTQQSPNMSLTDFNTGMYTTSQSPHMNGLNSPGSVHELGPGNGIRSVVLDNYLTHYLNKPNRRFDLKEAYNHVVEFCGHRDGSRFIQCKLETANSEEKEQVFNELLPNALQLMKDVFGNYVIQKFFQHGDQRQKKILAGKMKGQVLELAKSPYGCRVVQKALEHILTDQQADLVSELEHHVIECVNDNNGNHVVQVAIINCPFPTIRFIVHALKGQVFTLSSHGFGCRVIQRCLEHCPPADKRAVMDELKDGIEYLIPQQYGNYVVQHVVEKGSDEDRELVLSTVQHNLEMYSCNRYASNVVEKCVEFSTDHWRRRILESLISAPRREHKSLMYTLVCDQFGNYVIQKLLDHLGQHEYNILLDNLQPEMSSARRAGCTKQVGSIEKKMHRFGPHGYSLHYQHRVQSCAHSSGPSPPPLTFDSRSVQTSYPPSCNGDAIEGAANSRKGSEPSSDRSVNV